MTTTEHRKEDLSRAFVQAIAAKAGMTVSINGRSHDYGIDGQFHKVSIIHGKFRETGINLDFQAKATINFTNYQDCIKYELDTSTYNMLSERSSRLRATPAILILLCLPQHADEWFKLSDKELILKNCCYWTRITDQKTSNSSSITISIPTKRLLSPDSLTQLLEHIELKDDWEN